MNTEYLTRKILTKWTSRVAALLILAALSACSGGGSGGDDTRFTVNTTAGSGGNISPGNAAVASGDTVSFTVTPDSGFVIDTVSGCGGSLSGNTYTTGTVTADCTVSASFRALYTVTATAGSGGNISPGNAAVASGDTASFTVTPDSGFAIDTVSGCGGSLSGNTYTTGTVTADCTVSASFKALFIVTATAGSGGNISPGNATVASGDTASFTLTPDSGFAIDTVSGWGGSLSGTTYTTGVITADCTVSASFALVPPASAALPTLSFTQVKLFRFSWTDVAGATFYRLLENPDGVSGFTQVGADIPAGTQQYDHEVPLYARVNARYILQSCNAAGCTDSAEISVSDNLAAAVGYFKASNTEAGDRFGYSVALSGDGNTLAVGAYLEDSNATGIGSGGQADNTATDAGAVYVFIRDGNGSWVQQAYVKASNTNATDAFGSDDQFGHAVALSYDGSTLAVGAPYEDSNATGINGNDSDTSARDAGAVYVFTRTAGSWSQQAYVKASNTESDDWFGYAVALSADGNTLAVGAHLEDSDATVINPPLASQQNNSAQWSGAVYVYTRTGANWAQQAYIKASNANALDYFGQAVALSADGNTLAVGAVGEKSNATTVDGDPSDNSAFDAGAVYVFVRSGTGWAQQAYVKPFNTGANDRFGYSVALSADGDTLAVGAPFEDSNLSGISSGIDNDAAQDSGAVYVFTRSSTNIWSQQAYFKASSIGDYDYFGTAVVLSADGNTLAVGADGEDSRATGIGGDQGNALSNDSGAVYVFTRGAGNWAQQAYVKAPSIGDSQDRFGHSVALSGDGNTLAVGAYGESSNATGIGGDQNNNNAIGAGAVYLY